MNEAKATGLHRQWFGREFGLGSGRHGVADRPIVLLHEGLGSISTWGRFPSLLAEACGRPVLAYDRRGYGRSSANPPPWSADFMHLEAQELGQLLTEEHIQRPVLVGHSDGATIALLYPSALANDQPEPLAIVSLAAHLFVEQVCVDEIKKMRSGLGDQLIERLGPHHDDAASVFEGWSEIWTSDRFRDWAIDPQLAAVNCPVLAFQGLDDTYATRQQLERMEAAVGGPISLLDLPGCDHWPHREATGVVLEEIAAFCQRVDTLPR